MLDDLECCKPRMFTRFIERLKVWNHLRRFRQREGRLPEEERRPAWMMKAIEAYNYGEHSKVIRIIEEAKILPPELDQKLTACTSAIDFVILLYKLQVMGRTQVFLPLVLNNPLANLAHSVVLTGGFVADQLELLGRAKSPLYKLPEDYKILRMDPERICEMIWGENHIPVSATKMQIMRMWAANGMDGEVKIV